MITKICGLTRPEDAVAAVRAGADWIGINFWPESKRYCEPEVAKAVAAAARDAGDVDVVGVFVDQDADEVTAIVRAVGLDRVQLHGDESPQYCARFHDRYVKALRLRTAEDVARIADYDCDVVLVDTPSDGYGGSGVVGDWGLASSAVQTGRLVMLAGGLTPDNVAAAIAAVQPYGVDVAGGVEHPPGVKDKSRMVAFVAAAKGATR